MLITGKPFFFKFPDLREEIYNEMNAILQEEMGIARKVRENAILVRDRILKDSKTREKVYDRKLSCNTKSGSIEMDLFGINNVLITYVLLFLKGKDEFEEAKENGSLDSTSSCYIRKIGKGTIYVASISLSIPIVSGTPNLQFMDDSIQHEVEHIYQQKMAVKTYPNTPLYQKSVQGFMLCPEGSLEHSVGYLIYLSNNYEQDAYANGLYASIISGYRSGKTIDGLFRESQAYDRLAKMRQCITQVSDPKNKESLQTILYGYSSSMKASIDGRMPFGDASSFIKKMETSMRRFERKLMRVVMLAKSRIFTGKEANECILHKELVHPVNWAFYQMGRGI